MRRPGAKIAVMGRIATLWAVLLCVGCDEPREQRAPVQAPAPPTPAKPADNVQGPAPPAVPSELSSTHACGVQARDAAKPPPLRSAPDPGASVLSRSLGAAAFEVERRGDWIQVTTSTGPGWVPAGDVVQRCAPDDPRRIAWVVELDQPYLLLAELVDAERGWPMATPIEHESDPAEYRVRPLGKGPATDLTVLTLDQDPADRRRCHAIAGPEVELYLDCAHGQVVGWKAAQLSGCAGLPGSARIAIPGRLEVTLSTLPAADPAATSTPPPAGVERSRLVSSAVVPGSTLRAYRVRAEEDPEVEELLLMGQRPPSLLRDDTSAVLGHFVVGPWSYLIITRWPPDTRVLATRDDTHRWMAPVSPGIDYPDCTPP